MARIDAFLRLGREQGCSDIHFTVGLPPLVRQDGELTPLHYRELPSEEIWTLLTEILEPAQQQEFERLGSVDLSYAPEESDASASTPAASCAGSPPSAASYPTRSPA